MFPCQFQTTLSDHKPVHNSCNWDDYLALFSWSLIHNENRFKHMYRVFNYSPLISPNLIIHSQPKELQDFMTHFALWLCIESDIYSFINLLKIFQWYIQTYHTSL